MELDIDFANVKEFTPLPSGDYVVVISDAQLQPTKKDPSKYCLVCTYEVSGGDQDGQTMKEWIYIDPANPFGIKAFADVVLGEQDGLRINDDFLAQLCGMSLGVTVEESEYNGKPSSNVIAHFTA